MLVASVMLAIVTIDKKNLKYFDKKEQADRNQSLFRVWHQVQLREGTTTASAC